MRWAYIGMVRPMLSYASMIWGHRAPFHKAKFKRINRMAINTFGSFPRSTPTAALEVIMDIMPLELFCQQEALAARCRLNDIVDIGWDGTNKNKTHATSHLRAWANLLQQYEINPDVNDACGVVKWNAEFRVNTDSFKGDAKHRSLTQFNVFTDGSRKENQTGCGFVIYHHKREIRAEHYRLPDFATVFQAEITAIRQAADALSTTVTHNLKHVKIFVDSQAALKALANPAIRSRAVAEAVESLNSLGGKVTSLALCWIPAHRGHFGNERADQLAKSGSEMTTGEILPVGRPPAIIKAEIKNHVYKAWQQMWLASTEAKHSKFFYYLPNPSKAKYTLKLARLELGRFVRLVTGHNNLNYFQTRIGLHGDPACRLCGEADETFIHFVMDCPRLNTMRRDIFAGQLPSNNMAWSVRNLLDFTYNPTVNEAFEGTWAHGDPLDEDNLDPLGKRSDLGSSLSEGSPAD